MDPQFPTSLELDPKFVKTGIWTNRDDGPILGRTITTDTQTGNLIVALLAILSTLGTAHLWHLIAFAIHQFRANGLPTDALFRQQQALLRTLPTPSSVIAEALKLWWAWRRKADRPFLRSILLVLIAILFAALTTTASIFSSLIVDSGTITVLAQSPNCGQVNITREVWKTYKQAVDRSAPAYTQECYRNGTLPPSCDVFTQPSIPLTVENVPCPFNETMCDTKDAVSVDSGLIDVSKSFGLNLAAKDGISFRKKIECTVLPVDGYYRVFDLKDVDAWKPDYREIFPEEQVGATFYGPKPPFLTGETYLVYLVSSNSSGNPSVPRGVKWFQNGNATRLSDWIPIEGFYPITVDGPEGDVFLKPLMSGALSFDSPIDDPLYSAHKEIESMNYFTGEPYKNYIADYPIKTVGCHHHLQYCHARDGKEDWCSPFEGVRYPLLEEYDFPEANEVQRATLELLVKSTYMYPTADVLSCKMNRLLSMSTFEMKSIPDDFWKQEVLGWEQQVWAAMQIMVSRHAIGPEEGDPYSDGGYLIKPTTEGERTLCAAQKMKKNGGFVNINVFGFSFVVAFSILVAIIDITLLRFLVYLTRFRRALGPRIARWTQDGVWQLQRRAYEGEGHRNWTDLESEIPLMEKGHKLNDLPIMWRPGKSPIIMQTSSFDSTDSMVSQQSSVSELAAEDVVKSAPVVTEQRSWFSFVRR